MATPLSSGSCGGAAGLVDVMLVDDEGNEAGAGSQGECWVRPRHPHVIFNGYFDDPLATAAAFEGEWYKTGDLLRRDQPRRLQGQPLAPARRAATAARARTARSGYR